jgi:hypothetical protein
VVAKAVVTAILSEGNKNQHERRKAMTTEEKLIMVSSIYTANVSIQLSTRLANATTQNINIISILCPPLLMFLLIVYITEQFNVILRTE